MKTKFTLLMVLICTFFNSFGQQSLPNGSFENWTDAYAPTSWTSYEEIIPQIQGSGLIAKDSIDKYQGSYSVKLTSEYVALANDTVAGTVALGSGTFSGGSPKITGIPFASSPDTLQFAYKYAPSGSDTAAWQIQLKKAGGSTYKLQVFGPLFTTSGQWQLVSIPLKQFYQDTTGLADTLNLVFQSSAKQGNAHSPAGSVLHVDAVRFGYVAASGPTPAAYTMGHDPLGSHNFNLYGAINSQGDTAHYSFVYSPDSTFNTGTVTTPAQTVLNNAIQVLWSTVNSLSANTTYYYYLSATNTNGTSNGKRMSFYSDTVSFDMENTGADVYGSTYAEMNAKLSGLHGGPYTLGFEFGLTPDLGMLDTSNVSTVSDSLTHYFRAYPQGAGYTAGSLYFYRAKAVSAVDSFFTDIRGFFMGNPYTTLSALPATSLTATTADLNGTVQGFQVPIKINSEIDGPSSHFHSPLIYYPVTPSVINYVYHATGLTPNQHYGTRFKIDSWVGNFYGDSAFTTLPTGIEVENNAVNNILVYPNPASYQLMLEFKTALNSESKAQMFNLSGQMVSETNIAMGQSKSLINTTGLEAGIYILRLTAPDVNYNAKVTILK